MANKLGVFVSAAELVKAGAPKNAVKQELRKNDNYVEAKDEDVRFGIIYKTNGTSDVYVLPAKKSATEYAEKIASVTEVVWGGSIRDSYVLVSETEEE